ncbi:MAG: CheY-like chemotaxis protein [Arenicella sp.]|jgi:CheY-like chemotaxis protein
MTHSALIIDDEKQQTLILEKVFKKERPNVHTMVAYEEAEILEAIENKYFNIAIVDLKMDRFSIDGFDIIQSILEKNPFAKIIIVSAFSLDYQKQLAEAFKTGRVETFVEKGKGYDIFMKEIIVATDNIIADFESNSVSEKALETMYAEAKNETDSYRKGEKFEQFVSILFGQMGFNHINKRVIDKSQNEVDLIVRNENPDLFFQKFKPYFLIECKNTKESVNKNEFIQFFRKLEKTNGLANLGFLVTSSALKKTVYQEAMRDSSGDRKVVFISNIEIKQLIYANNKLEELKRIIDNQVKDN